MEISIAQEAQNPEKQAQNQGEVTKKQRKKDLEEMDNENQGQDPTPDNTKNIPSTSSNILTEVNIPMVELGLVPFTPSKQHEFACSEDIFFYPKRKSIVWKTENTLKMGTQPGITTVIEKTFINNV